MAKQPHWSPKNAGRSYSSASWVMYRIHASLLWSLVQLVSAITFCLHLEGSAPGYDLYGQVDGNTMGILKDPLGAAELSDTSDQRKQTPNWHVVA